MLVFAVSHLGILNSSHPKLRKPCTASFYSLIIITAEVKSALLHYACFCCGHLGILNSLHPNLRKPCTVSFYSNLNNIRGDPFTLGHPLLFLCLYLNNFYISIAAVSSSVLQVFSGTLRADRLLRSRLPRRLLLSARWRMQGPGDWCMSPILLR